MREERKQLARCLQDHTRGRPVRERGGEGCDGGDKGGGKGKYDGARQERVGEL